MKFVINGQIFQGNGIYGLIFLYVEASFWSIFFCFSHKICYTKFNGEVVRNKIWIGA